MKVGLIEAAKLTGKDPSTITRAANAGRLAFDKDESGSRVFDVAELERVYGKLANPDDAPGSASDMQSAAVHDALMGAKDAEILGLQREIRRLEDALADARKEREHWQNQASQITWLLTDEREQAVKDRERREREEVERRQQQPARQGGLLARLFGQAA